MSRSPYYLGAAVLALVPGALAAQVLPVPLGNSSIGQQSPAPTPTPFPSPAVPPAPTADVTPPTPAPTATPSAEPRPAETAPAIRRRAPEQPRPRATATPAPAQAAPAPTSTPSPAPTPVASSTPAAPATPRPPITTVVLPPPSHGAPLWPWLAGGGAVLLGLAALFLLRRRGEPEDAWPQEEAIAPEPAPEPALQPAPEPAPAPPPTTPAPAAPQPAFFARPAPAAAPTSLVVEMRPTRAGLNLLTATVEAELVVRNAGDTPATDVRAGVALFSAGATGEPDLARVAAMPVGQLAAPPFALAPGEERRVRAVAALPHDAIRPLQAANRPIFVPLVVAQLRWTDAAGAHGVAQSWAVGVERVDSPKLAPLWLDVPPRSYDAVAARPQAGPVTA